MPLLSYADLEQMKNTVRMCSCGQEVKRDYCREDDEFFERGHVRSCIMFTNEAKHAYHRTYRETQPPFNIKQLEHWEVV